MNLSSISYDNIQSHLFNASNRQPVQPALDSFNQSSSPFAHALTANHIRNPILDPPFFFASYVRTRRARSTRPTARPTEVSIILALLLPPSFFLYPLRRILLCICAGFARKALINSIFRLAFYCDGRDWGGWQRYLYGFIPMFEDYNNCRQLYITLETLFSVAFH